MVCYRANTGGDRKWTHKVSAKLFGTFQTQMPGVQQHLLTHIIPTVYPMAVGIQGLIRLSPLKLPSRSSNKCCNMLGKVVGSRGPGLRLEEMVYRQLEPLPKHQLRRGFPCATLHGRVDGQFYPSKLRTPLSLRQLLLGQ